ncbi:HNH endonuclease [Haloarchaeobius amylolyticus]|uniref:HNH endonuclease n=1 Tax=Haloarchaeobius amylolyticus TaxID=1198296 RepID=A0ABD6BCS2_9EURY
MRAISEMLEPAEQPRKNGAVEFDDPTTRGYEWTKRSKEIKKRDNKVCQRCGDHNGNYEYHPLVMETHHIVSGKYLPKADARVDLNLVTVCGTCHSHLERAPVEQQFKEIGRDNALTILRTLKEQEYSLHFLCRNLDLSDEQIQTIVPQLEQMNCITSRGSARYRATCPATSKSAAERARVQWHLEQERRQQLETALEKFRRQVTCDLDELEYALELGDVERFELTLERIRDALRIIPSQQ